jgi:serine/threonine protein kinase
MMIEDDDILFLSNNEDFISHVNIDNKNEFGEDRDIPAVVAGYKIGKFLGRGGFGEVRIGEHHLTSEKVALKFITRRQIMNIDAVERTTTEIQCLTALRHHNIIKFIQVYFCLNPC